MTRPNDTLNTRFLTDAMLGKLTRWLRVLGCDTLFNPAQDDCDLVAIADAENRVLLTRDRHLITFLRPAHGLLLANAEPLHQLVEVVERLQLPPPQALFTRCLVCNTTVHTATAAQARGKLPRGADVRPHCARYCPGCHRLYWEGSHTRRMRETLEQAIPGWVPQ